MKKLSNATVTIRDDVREIRSLDGYVAMYSDNHKLAKELAMETYGSTHTVSTIAYKMITVCHEDLGKLTFKLCDNIKFVNEKQDWDDILRKEKIDSIRSKLNSEEVMYLLQGGTLV
ncbi:hypothetical protein ASwh1_56 [Aeromonas phage Aswh_1]|nr:hypothetical protein ASwh1_56 [Aeromonas phage Aswh_1]